MVWGWVHNFPVSVDVFTKPIDYPDVGYDTVIADWLQDIFDAVETIEDTLGYDIRDGFADLATRLSGRIYHTRIVGNTPDFNNSDFDTDGGEHTLNLSGIIPVGTKAVLLNGAFHSSDAFLPGLCAFYPSAAVGFAPQGDSVELVFSVDPPAFAFVSFNVIIPVDGDRAVKYALDVNLQAATTRVSVTGWFK